MTQLETTKNQSNINPKYLCNRPGIDPNSTENHGESTQNRHSLWESLRDTSIGELPWGIPGCGENGIRGGEGAGGRRRVEDRGCGAGHREKRRMGGAGDEGEQGSGGCGGRGEIESFDAESAAPFVEL